MKIINVNNTWDLEVVRWIELEYSYTYIYIYIYTYIYTYIHTYICTYPNTHTHIYNKISRLTT